jgi:hypothetical protein
MTSDQQHLLHIYLRDHEAAAAGGLQLFRRSAKSNRGTPYWPDLQRLAEEISVARDALRAVCRQFDVTPSKVGRAAAFAGATLGRLKPNGRLFHYSPLSRVIELEAMTSGVISQRGLWESLVLVAEHEPRLDREAMTCHVVDADQQLETLRGLRDRAAQEAFV